MLLVKAFDTTRTSMVIRLSSTSLVPRSSPGCRPSVDRVRLRVAPLIMRPTPAATTPGDFKPGDRDRPHEKRRAHHRCNLGQGIRRSGRQPRYVSLVEAGGFADVAPVLGSREALGEGRKLLGNGGTLHRLAVARGQHARPQRSHLPDGVLGGVQSGVTGVAGREIFRLRRSMPKNESASTVARASPAKSTRPSGRNRQT
jgi:hypothetical protein